MTPPFLTAAINLAKKYNLHVDSVISIAGLYGIRETEYILKALKSPGKRYFIRVNTLKASREEVLAEMKDSGFEAKPYSLLEEAIYLPIRGPYRVKIYPKKVIADKKAAESVYLGANLYAVGVLKIIGKAHEGDRVTITDPTGFPVGEGVLAMDPDRIFSKRRGLAVKTVRSVFDVPSIRELDLYKRGWVYDQSLPAIISVRNLSLKPGFKVIDLCAAPGGKTSHAAQLMENAGEILAVDRSKPKVRKLRENLQRLGVKIVKILEADARYLDLIVEERDFDAAIVDPPCSSLGVRPKLSSQISMRNVLNLSRYQFQFLKVASKLVRRRGRILYSTCTLTLQENELVILKALKKLNLKLIDQKYFAGTIGFIFEGNKVQRFLPHVHDTPGFFIAVLEKL
ncbi:MAG: 16S rRNA methyltransferase [Thermoprotei archaeon]|nr:MAG: 16S rRNA methyltransferase [Thermoprotei archaeon]